MKVLLRVKRQYMRSNTGLTYWADPASVLGLQLLTEDVHEPQMTRLLMATLRPGDVFVDVGGNEGYFSILAASLVGDGKVHCIEPQQRLLPVLRENLRVNAVQNVIIHPVALSEREGEVALYLRPSTNTGASSLKRHWRIGTAKEKVHTTTLDLLFTENSIESARLLKVDCEGAENLVVAGARRALKRQVIDFIAMEYHPSICGTDACAGIHQELTDSGYQLARVNGQCIYHLPHLGAELQPLGDLQVGRAWNA